MKEKKQKAGKIKNILTNAAVGVVAVFALTLAGLRVFGFKTFTVMSGSMEPFFKTGSLIYVSSVDPKTLRGGDVITYLVNDKTVATHRIVEVIEETDDNGETVRRFRTKGDANEAADAKLVHEKNVVGKFALSLPFLGYLASYIQRPPGIYVAIIVGMLLLMAVFLPDTEVKKRKEEKIYQQFS